MLLLLLRVAVMRRAQQGLLLLLSSTMWGNQLLELLHDKVRVLLLHLLQELLRQGPVNKGLEVIWVVAKRKCIGGSTQHRVLQQLSERGGA